MSEANRPNLCMWQLQFSVKGEGNIKLRKANCDPTKTCYQEFDWILLCIGDGHYELNMYRAFMELNWDVFMSDVSSTFSFRSPLAQASAKRCDYTHTFWSILLSCYLSTFRKLVLPYVRKCLSSDDVPTHVGFFSVCRHSTAHSQLRYAACTI